MLNVITLSPEIALIVDEIVAFDTSIVPASFDSNVYCGVALFVSVGTAIFSLIAGGLASYTIVNDVTFNGEETFPAASVTVIVILL